MGVGGVNHLHSLAIEILAEVLLAVGIGVGGQRPERQGRLDLIHAVEHPFMSQHGRAVVGIAKIPGCVAAREGRARLGDLFVPAGVIGIRAGVDDEADRLGRLPGVNNGAQGGTALRSIAQAGDAIGHGFGLQLAHGIENFIGHSREAGVHHENAVLPHGNGDVRTRADQHIDVAAHGQNVYLGGAGLGRGNPQTRGKQHC